MKLFLVRRKLITAVACLLLAAGMFYVVNHPAIVGAAATTRQLPMIGSGTKRCCPFRRSMG